MIPALCSLAALALQGPAQEADYYTVDHLVPPEGALLEVGGMDWMPDGRLAVSTRRGQVWLIENALDATAANQAKCADLLGINRNTLRKKITDLDIRVTRRRKLM